MLRRTQAMKYKQWNSNNEMQAINEIQAMK